MIFYFTSTGNSLYAAKKFDNDLHSIPQEVNYFDPEGSELAASPGSANVAPKHSPSFELWEYTLMPPHRRVIDEARHKPSVMQKLLL